MAFSGIAQAGAFQIWEQNGAGTGDYHAGGAAIANDASTIFYNPAGLMRLKKNQVVLSAVAIPTYMKFHGTVSTYLAGNQTSTSTGSANGGGFTLGENVVPSFYIALPINSKWAIGFGQTVPFGLATNYARNSVAANFSTSTVVKVLDFTPVIAYQLTHKMSLGFGLDFEHMDATFDNFVSSTISDDHNSGSAWGTGWHAGFLYQASKNTRVGLTYHSQVRFHLKGKSAYYTNGVETAANYNLKANATLPNYTVLSVFHQFNKRWAGLASLTYIQWNVFRKLTLQNLALLNGGDSTLQQHFTNTFNLALGAHYTINKKWMLKAGVGFDQSPVHGVYRNLRLPDQDHYALAFGVHFQPLKDLGLDLGYAHIFISKAKLNNNTKLGTIAGLPDTVVTTGHTDSYANIIGAQLTWTA
jgi:long-chain fatty acid transport protein